MKLVTVELPDPAGMSKIALIGELRALESDIFVLRGSDLRGPHRPDLEGMTARRHELRNALVAIGYLP